MKIKNGDFVEIDFVGRIKATGEVFDLTIKEVAKKEGLHREGATYSPLVFCIGKNEVVKGLDEFLVDKEVGKEYDVEIRPEKAFGMRNNKLMQLVPINKFRGEKINPFPGLQVTINGVPGTVTTASSGRVIVDFNHPLAGRELAYHLNVKGIVTDTKKKVNSVLHNYFGFEDENLEIKNDSVVLHQELSEELRKNIREKVAEIVPSLKDIIVAKKEPKAEKNPHAGKE